MQAANLQGDDVRMLDTAGRLHVDQALMDEMKAVADVSSPQEILLVVDALTGQDAVNVAKSFSEQVEITGVVLTRLDGAARGGEALTTSHITAKPRPITSLRQGIENNTTLHHNPDAGSNPRTR